MKNKSFVCDPETGLCHPADLAGGQSQTLAKEQGKEIIYIGDPMCSWCWGISNHLRELKEHFAQFQFSILLGGLRPGGGDPWNDKMKAFLQHHWEEVNKRSGQPFGYTLFDLENFNYDTEPSCRAVVTSRTWLKDYVFEFYEEVSRKFYVENEDPNTLAFYQSICEQFAIPFAEFSRDFASEEIKQATRSEFHLSRTWGVNAYPTVLFRVDKKLFRICQGYAEFGQMKSVLEAALERSETA